MANNNHFELTLDTLAPEGSIGRGSTQFHKENFALTITKGDATFMYVWYDQSASTTEIPSETAVIEAATSYTTTFTTSGNFYYHLVLMDDVGNKSAVYTTDVICFDNILPVVDATQMLLRDGTEVETTTTREIAIRFKAHDDATSSGLVSCAISGDINVDSTAWSAVLTASEIAALSAGNWVTRDIVLSGSGEEEANKTVGITVTDAAGNTAAVMSDTIYLDTIGLDGHIILKSADKSKTITEQWVNVADFVIHLDASEKADWKGYKVWGDFNTDGGATATSEPTSYTDLTAEEIAAKKVELSRKWTSGDNASKKVYAKLIDNSGIETQIGTTHVSPETEGKYDYAKVDYTAPVVSFSIKENEGARIKTHVSQVTGFTTQVLVPVVDSSISGSATYQWYMDGTAYTGGSGTGDPSEFTIDSANMGAEGGKAFTLKVTDNAGNSTTSSAVVIYVDLTAPTGTITMDAWYNGDSADQTTYKKFSTAGATASATDGPSGSGAAGVKYMTCWCSQTATDTTVVGTQRAYSSNPGHSMIDWTGHGESATNYIHIEYVDAVGNKAITHSAAFGIDTDVPESGAVTFTKESYPSTTAQVVLTKSDATSGMGTGAQFKVWGDISNGSTTISTEDLASWESIADSKSVTLTTGDGTKYIYVRYKDVAGNISTGTAASDSAVLDTSAPSATLTLHVTGTSTTKPARSCVKESDLHIALSGAGEGKEFYCIYGDFTIDGTQVAQGLEYKACTLYKEDTAYAVGDLILHESAIYKAKVAITAAENTSWSAISSKVEADSTYWKEFVNDTGVEYKNVATVCTSGDGTKNFHCKVMDAAGNISPEASTSFIYDTTKPVPAVSGVDHNRISKVHTKRLQSASGAITELETYNDETKWTTSCDSVFVEYKVVAYVSQAAATAGSYLDAAVPTTSGSVNMTGTGTWGPGQTAETISHTIKGADYESALIAKYNTSGMTQAEAEAAGFVFSDGDINAIDGAHYVVVYVKDEAGNWSAAASFTA